MRRKVWSAQHTAPRGPMKAYSSEGALEKGNNKLNLELFPSSHILVICSVYMHFLRLSTWTDRLVLYWSV